MILIATYTEITTNNQLVSVFSPFITFVHAGSISFTHVVISSVSSGCFGNLSVVNRLYQV
jgi:hypothetical protein